MKAFGGTVAGEQGRWRTVLRRLGAPAARPPLPLGNKDDPYDELIYVLLTVMTRSQPRIDLAFDGLRALTEDRGWSRLLDVPRNRVEQVMTPLGFVNRRTDQLLMIVARVREQFGGTLEPLRSMPDDQALAVLLDMPGVGTKTAKCVLMYSLERDVMPVDVHVLRVAKRLGLVPPGMTWGQTDRFLEETVPSGAKFDAHVLLVEHGRTICKSVNPQCPDCPLVSICPSANIAATDRAVYTLTRRRPKRERDDDQEASNA